MKKTALVRRLTVPQRRIGYRSWFIPFPFFPLAKEFTMRAGFASLMGLLLIGSFGFSGGDAAKEDSAKMQGIWSFVSHESNGKATSKEELKNMTVTIKGDTWAVKAGDKVVHGGTQTLDPSK